MNEIAPRMRSFVFQRIIGAVDGFRDAGAGAKPRDLRHSSCEMSEGGTCCRSTVAAFGGERAPLLGT